MKGAYYMWFLIILLIISIIILIVLLVKYKTLRLDTLNIVSGGLGSGKTSSVICRVVSLLRKIYFIKKPKRVKNDYIIISNFPVGKFDKKHKCRYIRIWFTKVWCYDLNSDILLMKKRLPQNEVILIIDEFSNLASQFDYNKPVLKDNINEFIRNFRHYTSGLGYIFAIDQCSNNIALQIRRRANYCYNFIACKKIPLLPLVFYSYRKIIISDEISNELQVSDNSNENDIVKCWFLINPFKYYDSFCYSERYKAIKIIAKLTSLNTLKRNDVMRINVNDKVYYACLKFDKISKRLYLSLNKPVRAQAEA